MFKPTPKGFVPLGLVKPPQEVLHSCDLCSCFIFFCIFICFPPQSPFTGRRGSQTLISVRAQRDRNVGLRVGTVPSPAGRCPVGCHCGVGMSLCLEKQPALHHPSHGAEHNVEIISIPLPSWLRAAYSSSLYFLYFNLPHLHIHRSK